MDAGPIARTKARIRLSELSVHAIALVSEGANLRRFAEVRKALTMDGSANKALVLPKAAQEQLSSGISRGLEAMSALLDLIKTAQVSEDSAVMVPQELADQIKATGMMVAALADQFGAAPPASVAAPAAPGSDGMSAEEMALAAKAAEHVQKTAKSLVDNVDKVSKGKVRMSFESALKLINGATSKVYEIAAQLAPLVAEFGADGVAAMGASLGLGEADKTAKSLEQPEPLKRVEDALAALRGDVDKISKSRNPSNAGAPREGGGEAPTHRVQYGKDYSAIVRNENARANGAAS